MNLKKTLYNIHLSNNNFFNIRNGKIKYEIVKKNLVFENTSIHWEDNGFIKVNEKNQIKDRETVINGYVIKILEISNNVMFQVLISKNVEGTIVTNFKINR